MTLLEPILFLRRFVAPVQGKQMGFIPSSIHKPGGHHMFLDQAALTLSFPRNLPPSPPTHLPSQSSNRVHLITPLMKPLPSFPHIPDISLLHVLQGFLIHSSFSLPPLGLGHHLKGADRESEGSGVWSEAGGQVWLHRWDPVCRPMEPSRASLLPVHTSGQVRPGSP